MNAILIVATLIAAPLGADSAPASASGVPTPTKERMICHDDPETGSLIPKRVCHTKAQWQAILQAQQSGVDAWRDKPMHGFCPPNNPGCAG